MGAGKTTVGRLLAAKLGVPFTDSDHVIEARAGKPIRQIFADDGEPAFRQLEHEVIADLLAGQDMVLALGGGAAVHERTAPTCARRRARRLPAGQLRRGDRRVGGDRGRPMLARPDVADLYAARSPRYAQAATFTVDADERSPEEHRPRRSSPACGTLPPAVALHEPLRLAHPLRLPGGLEHRHPQVAVRVDLVAARRSRRESGCARNARASARPPSPSARPSRRAPRPAPAAGSTPRPSRWPARCGSRTRGLRSGG